MKVTKLFLESLLMSLRLQVSPGSLSLVMLLLRAAGVSVFKGSSSPLDTHPFYVLESNVKSSEASCIRYCFTRNYYWKKVSFD